MTDTRHIRQFPHCDQQVLHKPGNCRHCDSHPEWQELREAWGISFTNEELEEGQLPCPSDFRRGKGGAHVWGGNYPRPSVLTDCPACNGVGYNAGANMCGSCQGTGHIP